MHEDKLSLTGEDASTETVISATPRTALLLEALDRAHRSFRDGNSIDALDLLEIVRPHRAIVPNFDEVDTAVTEQLLHGLRQYLNNQDSASVIVTAQELQSRGLDVVGVSYLEALAYLMCRELPKAIEAVERELEQNANHRDAQELHNQLLELINE